jgi:hypothetical protein
MFVCTFIVNHQSQVARARIGAALLCAAPLLSMRWVEPLRAPRAIWRYFAVHKETRKTPATPSKNAGLHCSTRPTEKLNTTEARGRPFLTRQLDHGGKTTRAAARRQQHSSPIRRWEHID